jgi:hypothetical protein
MAEEKHTEPRPFTAALIQLHIAEYSALTNRNTYWITIQSSVWVTILLYVTVMAYIWSSRPQYGAVILWGSAIVVQFALAGLYSAGQEIYRNVYYMEHDLRQMVQEAIGKKIFWQYERFLAKKSNKSPLSTDIAPTVFFLFVFALVVLIRHSVAGDEWIGLLVNIPFTVALILQTLKLVHLRRKFEAVL